LCDPFGHVWIISQVVENLSKEEIKKRTEDYFKTVEDAPT